jgi:hypothetical protein
MSVGSDAADADLSGALADSLARERALGRTYRLQMQSAWSPRVRRLWEDGWAVKRGHDEALVKLLSVNGGAPASEASPPAAPSPREVLSWVYDQERILVLRYREYARRAVDPEARRLLDRLVNEQTRLIQRLRETYRDYSAA